MSASVTAIIRRGGESDNLEACARALADGAGAHPVELLVTGAEQGDPAPELNRAGEAAAGEILVFLDGGVVAVPGLVERIVALHAGGADVVGIGQVVPAAGSHPLASVRARREPGGEEPDLSACAGQVLSVPAAAFRRAGGFTPGIGWGGEVELVHRLRAQGLELRGLGDPAAHRARRTGLRAAIGERVAAGRGSAELWRRVPALLPSLELGGFHAGQPPGLGLRRLLLALGAPPVPVGLGRALPSRSLRQRWLRFQHDYHFWRGARRVLRGTAHWPALQRAPVILMYHAIGRRDERAGCYVVPVHRFRRQLRWLRRRGYRVIGLDELLAARRAHQPPPARAVVITFDDGYLDNRELAARELRALGFTATFFLVSERLGGRNTWDRRGELAGRWMLSWEDARALLAAGMSVGAHTRTHPVLPEHPAGVQRREIAGAREDLEQQLGHPVGTFAYPFGRLDDTTVAAVAEGGYEGACCSRSGVNDPCVSSLLLRRVEVRGTDSLLRFALAVHRGWTPRRKPR